MFFIELKKRFILIANADDQQIIVDKLETSNKMQNQWPKNANA